MTAEHRKLATIMFTDMVCYSTLTQKNEALALTLLAEQRALLRGIFRKHGGREIEAVQRAIDETEKIAMPQFFWTRIYLVVANVQLGRTKEAHVAMTELLKLYPGIATKWGYHTDMDNMSAHYTAVMTEGLRKAGLFDPDAGK